MVRDNPHVPQVFAEHVQSHAARETLPADLERYEAAAVEWLLLGLVELPPDGVATG